MTMRQEPEQTQDLYGLRDYLDLRFGNIERRLDRIEGAGPRAGAYGAIGTVIGAIFVTIASYLGIGPKQQ